MGGFVSLLSFQLMKSLHVSVPRQEVSLYDDGKLLWRAPASTSRFGLGTIEGSNCTPLGNFRICEKYGAQAPLGTIFQGRKPIGVWKPGDEVQEDLVLTRIFRLEGLEPGLENTYSRYIYFHGTNQESLIGNPASHGCVRLTNQDMADLYPQIPVGTLVTITNETSS